MLFEHWVLLLKLFVVILVEVPIASSLRQPTELRAELLELLSYIVLRWVHSPLSFRLLWWLGPFLLLKYNSYLFSWPRIFVFALTTVVGHILGTDRRVLARAVHTFSRRDRHRHLMVVYIVVGEVHLTCNSLGRRAG